MDSLIHKSIKSIKKDKMLDEVIRVGYDAAVDYIIIGRYKFYPDDPHDPNDSKYITDTIKKHF